MRRLGRAYLKHGQLGIGEMETEFGGKNFRDEIDYGSSSSSNIYRIGFSQRGKFRIILDVSDPKRPSILDICDADTCHRTIPELIGKARTADNGHHQARNGAASLFDELRNN